ncbi:MAG: hypothetical protein IK139_04745 [Lachnospiraceae bacterium]|nr:hypothetical protein [Lachnospiraceae bacterium]
MSHFIDLFVVFGIAFASIGVPAIRRTINENRRKTKASKRRARDFGAIMLDGKRISERGKGVINPDAMYSETNRAD